MRLRSCYATAPPMSPEPSPPSTKVQRRPPTIAAARVLRRAMLPMALAAALLFFWKFGTLTVPAGMDTLEELLPPGTVCVVDKRPWHVRPGAVVFVDLPDGGTLLSRVERVDGDRLWLRHDNPKSRFADGEELGALSVDAVRALVLTAFASEPEGPR